MDGALFFNEIYISTTKKILVLSSWYTAIGILHFFFFFLKDQNFHAFSLLNTFLEKEKKSGSLSMISFFSSRIDSFGRHSKDFNRASHDTLARRAALLIESERDEKNSSCCCYTI